MRLLLGCVLMLAVVIGLNVTLYCIERWLLRRRIERWRRVSLSNADLLKLAERHPAPQEWYDEP